MAARVAPRASHKRSVAPVRPPSAERYGSAPDVASACQASTSERVLANAEAGTPGPDDSRRGRGNGLRSRGLGGQDGAREVSGSPGVRHDSVGETDPEHVLQAQEQFDPLEAPNAQVTIERVVELDGGASRRAAQLRHERPHDLEDLPLDHFLLQARHRCGRHGEPLGRSCKLDAQGIPSGKLPRLERSPRSHQESPRHLRRGRLGRTGALAKG